MFLKWFLLFNGILKKIFQTFEAKKFKIPKYEKLLGDKDVFLIKIGDFGLASKLNNINELKTTLCGTRNYLAPEILNGSKGHGYKIDIWAVGVIMYYFLNIILILN